MDVKYSQNYYLFIYFLYESDRCEQLQLRLSTREGRWKAKVLYVVDLKRHKVILRVASPVIPIHFTKTSSWN